MNDLLLSSLLCSWTAPTEPPPSRTVGVDAPDEVVAPEEVAPEEVASEVAPPDVAPAQPEPVDPPAAAEKPPAPTVAAKASAPAVVTAEGKTKAKDDKPIDPNKDPTPIEKSRYVPGKGVEFATKDGRFTMQLRARVQVRYQLDNPNIPDSQVRQAMLIRRARVQIQGNVFGEHNKYYIQFGFSPLDQTGGLVVDEGSVRRTPLRDARVEFDYLRDFTIQAGQMKVPFSRQRVISSGNLNLPDRSLANEEFQVDRDIGIQALSKDLGGMGWLGYNVGVFMGEGRNSFEPGSFDMEYAARVEARPFGKFDDYSEGDVDRSKKPGLSIGAAYVFHDDAIGDRGVHGAQPADGGTTDLHNVTADIFFKWYGASLATAFHWRKGFNRINGGAVDDAGDPIATVGPRNGLAWYVQPGYLVPKIPLEIVVRYGLVRRQGDISTLTWKDELGAGINYYFAGHNLKLQLDYFRLWGADTGPTVANAIKHGGDRVRLQLQLAF